MAQSQPPPQAEEHGSPGSAAERRLARLRFDLHDGPQQDVYLLAQDLRLFREQLSPLLAGRPAADRVLGRLDDLEAQVAALDAGLRRFSTSMRSPLTSAGALPEDLARLTEAFTRRTGIAPAVRITGDSGRLSDSQQTAVLALVREALSNIRRHARARTVSIVIAAQGGGVRVEIRDDGDGFDPQTAEPAARDAGRLGLVGMRERVRMLGGQARIDSRPGGPTVVSATLPPWPA
ncbi:MAG TPA: ATP-binding protein [Solirubrobacteraceae bacterium]|nr:ATP-binding protein [Solirubrobacteraceae bacterium]